MATQKCLQVGHAADSAQVTNPAILTIQIGHSSTVGQASDTIQHIIEAPQVFQGRAAPNTKRFQPTAGAQQIGQLLVSGHIQRCQRVLLGYFQ